MKSTFAHAKNSKISLDVTLDAADFKPYFDHEYTEALRKVNLKGFRPGAAPEALAAQALDRVKVLELSMEGAVRATLNDLTEEHQWTIIDQPHIDVTSEKDPLKEGFSYQATITVFPAIQLSDYNAIKAIVHGKKQPEIVIGPERITESLTWLQKSRAPMTRVARPAKNGDVLEADITTRLDGKPIPGGDVKHDRFEIGAGRFIPGFEEKLIGHKEGERIEFMLLVPKTYWRTELQEKSLAFTVTVLAVFELTLPALDDAFAKNLGKFTTLDELKKSITDGLRDEEMQKYANAEREEIIKTISAKTTIDIPEIFIEKTIDQMIAEIRPTPTRDAVRAGATERVRAQLVLHEIAKRESLIPTKEEIESELPLHERETKQLDASKRYDYIYGVLLNRKVFAFLDNKK